MGKETLKKLYLILGFGDLVALQQDNALGKKADFILIILKNLVGLV